MAATMIDGLFGFVRARRISSFRMKTIGGLASIFAFFALGACAPSTSDSISRSVDVAARAEAVWEVIGPFCSVADWHPGIGTCEEDGETPAGRTLVTADGAATIVEQQTDRDDDAHTYSYTILSGPFPFTEYVSTISVDDNEEGGSTITWSSTYVPDEGAEDAVVEILTGIYDGGLASIAASFAE